MWVWMNSGSWWWIGRPGELQSKGSQSWTRLRDRTTQLLSIMDFCHQWEVHTHSHLSKFLYVFCFVIHLNISDLPQDTLQDFCSCPSQNNKVTFKHFFRKFGWMLLFNLFVFWWFSFSAVALKQSLSFWFQLSIFVPTPGWEARH